MAPRVAFSAPGLPHAECLRVVLIGTYVMTYHLALMRLPSGRGIKTCLFGSYKCPQSLGFFSWSECFSTSMDVVRKNATKHMDPGQHCDHEGHATRGAALGEPSRGLWANAAPVPVGLAHWFTAGFSVTQASGATCVNET